MDTISGNDSPTQTGQEEVNKTKFTLSSDSYDADTPTIQGEGGSFPLRISGVDGTEVGAGSNAEFHRDGLYSIFGGAAVEVDSQGKGVFGRTLGNASVDGMDWRHVLYESGVSENWGKYGYDEAGSDEDSRYKWYSGQTQTANLEAYQLLESGVEPSAIISDEEYNKIELLRNSFKTHLQDANEGVLDKDVAIATAKELFKDSDALTLAQKRKWYEMARESNVGEQMLSAWNDPYTRADLERYSRGRSLDVKPSVDTSLWGMVTNSLKQQGLTDEYTGDMDGRMGMLSSYMSNDTDQSKLDHYIQSNDVTPDIAAVMHDKLEVEGFNAAVDYSRDTAIHEETSAQRNAINDRTGWSFVAGTLANEALPYVVDPSSWVASGTAAQLAARTTFAKVTSPLVQKMLQYGTMGAATGLAESMVFTANNYKDFSNEELLKTWATDAGFGAAFGSVFAAAEVGVRTYGTKVRNRAAGEGLDDINYTPTEDVDETLVRAQEDEAFKVRAEEDAMFAQVADEAQNMQYRHTDELRTQLQTGKGDAAVFPVNVEDYAVTPKPAPRVEEPTLDSTTPQVDSRTPEEVESDEKLWQTVNVASALEHQKTVVKPAIEKINKSHNVFAKLHRWLGKSVGLQDFSTKLITSEDTVTSYIGTHILESGAGFTGKMKRKASAALIKDSIYTRNVSKLNNSYVDNIKAWSMKQGSNKYKAFKAAWEGGKVNKTAVDFHRAAMLRQESLHMGYKVEPDEHLDSYLSQLNKTNDELFEGRISANVKGFDAARRIKNYVPHVWKKVKVGQITKTHGEQAVLDLLVQSIESAKRAGKIADNKSTTELAKKQLNWINGLGDSMEHTDSVGAGVSGRGKARIPLDFTVEHNGISMLDLIDTDLPSVMDSYIQRAGADIGISEATNGLIRSEGDFEEFLTPSTDGDKLLAQDARDLLYGRPTRDGMAPEMRSVMDLATVQQMGGIGIAQLAETGTMAQRLVVNYMAQPKIAKKIWAMAGESMDDKGVLHQVRSISAVNDSMEYINRYSVNNIDQAQVDELSDLRAASLDAVDKVTLGAYKAQFGRMLGSLSGVNAVQKAQSRLLQSSFSVDVARSAKFDKGTSTKERLTDLGLTSDGKAFSAIKKHVEFDTDGFPTNFNFDSWDKDALDEFVYAMNREEAQLMPRVMSGELPVFMNKPLWQAIMQFRKTPLAFMSKGAQRNLQFADREAVLGTVLNSMTAGLSRYAKFAAAGGVYTVLSDEEFHNPSLEQMQPYNYVSNLGILGDSYSLFRSLEKASEKDGIESLWEGAKQIPMVSSTDSAYHALQGDPTAIKQSMPLNTLPLITEVSNAIIKNMEK